MRQAFENKLKQYSKEEGISKASIVKEALVQYVFKKSK